MRLWGTQQAAFRPLVSRAHRVLARSGPPLPRGLVLRPCCHAEGLLRTQALGEVRSRYPGPPQATCKREGGVGAGGRDTQMPLYRAELGGGVAAGLLHWACLQQGSTLTPKGGTTPTAQH